MKPIDPTTYTYALGVSFVLFSWLVFHFQDKWGGRPFLKAMSLGILLIAASILWQRASHHKKYYELRLHQWEASHPYHETSESIQKRLGAQSLGKPEPKPRYSRVR